MTNTDSGLLSATRSEGAKPSSRPSSSHRSPTTEERDLAIRLASASISDAIGVYIRSDRHRHFSIADLEWMLMPPLVLNQTKFAFARPKRKKPDDQLGESDDVVLPAIAIALVTWAFVSPTVAAKLDAQAKAGQLCRLAPEE